ncbi:MAG TPA: protein-L-isoaspartate(D-aspartate) O-methyltransferase [Vitreimonas sp.]|uniref:protein-L-isoaspartate(D-aspartate) O-methyltransferase n=1 Tax=Vitreimonas sp. TaxID=3069702 RepID=UPI002D5BAC7C|nr:protein-L-isoaspartate(D-aspartate) O-methyltransferase [Vitreimonas sp.]HYD88388.1 protein-L-isoaspartate(D-aspartate) O-methyltransferase [Vitreimonas sp.]
MSDAARLMRFVLELRQAGVTDARALSAMERTPRTHYAPEHLDGLAYDDISLPLAHGQTMTKPSLVGRVLAALAPQPGDAVLEIGTGSGFQSACIANLANKVVTLERWRDLTADARGKFGTARLMRIFAHTADGFEGWGDEAPYDRIVVNGALGDIPQALLDQLKPGGVLLAPIGDAERQRLIRYRNGAREDLGPVKFAPLERGLPEEPPLPA